MNYSQALEQQIHVGRRYLSLEAEKGLLTDLVRSYDNDRLPTGEAAEKAMLEVILSPLLMGETFYWSPEMCSLLEHSASTLLQWICDTSLPIVPCGFCWLARPFWAGKRYLWGFGWLVLQGAGALSFACYTFDNIGDPPVPGAFFVVPNGTVVAQEDLSFEKFTIIGAALLLLNQRILVADQQRAERHTRKRLAAAGYEHEPLVRVVELRRKAAKSEHHGDSEPVEWSHQWIVSGHWRQQWYPSLNANQPRWIMPYVKGPEDKPLKPPRAKVFAVVR